MHYRPAPDKFSAPAIPTSSTKSRLPLALSLVAFVMLLLPAHVHAQSVTLTDDARTDASKANKNFGADDILQVRGTIERGLLKFKLTPNLPPGTNGGHVGKATLKLFVGKIGAPGQIVVQRVTGAWAEQSVTDATFPVIGATEATVAVAAGGDGKWVTVDLTQLVKDWLDGLLPNNGVALVSPGGAEVTFDSKENKATSHEPQLDIVLNHAATADQATAADTAATANTISGVLPTNKGGTGLGAPGATGNVLRSNGANWTSAPLLATDFPSLANSFIQNQSATTQTATFSINGKGTANIFDAATQFNIGGSRVFSVSGGNVTATGVGPVVNSNTFGGAEAGASAIPSAATAAGNFNTFFGVKAGMNTAKTSPAAAQFDGCCNSFFGNLVGLKNTTGHSNAFVGGAAGIGNTVGSFNSFFGDGAGSDSFDPNVQRTGSLNTFIGFLSGGGVTAGSNNTFLGANTRGTSNIEHATAIGADSSVTTSDTIVLGKPAGTYNGVARPADTVRIPGDLNVAGALTLNIVNAATQFNLGGNRILSNAGNSNLFIGTGAGASNSEAFNTFVGNLAGNKNTTGSANAFFGNTAGWQNTTGYHNSFFGAGSGYDNVSANDNSFFGFLTGLNSTAGDNSFFGSEAGFANQTGTNNAFFGRKAGYSNTASENSFFGAQAGEANTAGDRNAFFGVYAGQVNTTGCCNSFFGNKVGRSNTTGRSNAFFGGSAGRGNTEGSFNAFFGDLAGTLNTTGNSNTIIGNEANVGAGNLNYATALGANALVRTSDTIVLGKVAGNYLGVAHPADTVQIPGDLNVAGALTLNIVNATTQYNLGGNRILSTVGFQNTFVGLGTGAGNVAGCCNAFFGFNAGRLNNANDNSFFGNNAGQANTTGARNSFFGSVAGFSNQEGTDNSFFGVSAGQNSTGYYNSFFGSAAGRSNTSGGANSFFGTFAGFSNMTGGHNSFMGYQAGNRNTSQSDNTFIGFQAGASNGEGDTSNLANFNTFVGSNAGWQNTTACCNAFFGFNAGRLNNANDNSFLGNNAGAANTTGARNSFFGSVAGFSNQTGSDNSFFGVNAGRNNTANNNSFFGSLAGMANVDGPANSFFGVNAGRSNTSGGVNAFFGTSSGFNNVNGSHNSFFGVNAGASNVGGIFNSFFGKNAGFSSNANYNTFFGAGAGEVNISGTNNTFIGVSTGAASTTGSNNTLLGANANTGADGLTNATAIGANAQAGQSNTLVLGSINGVNGATADTRVGIGTTAPTSRLTVAGLIETTTGGVKFPDGTVQTTAAAGVSVTTDSTTLTGNGTAASPLAIKGLGVGTAQLADSSVNALKIASGQVVKNLNGLTDGVTLAAGANVTITPTGNTLTIAATGGGGGGSGSFIQNQTTQQTSANFNIDGTGKANIFDAATQYNLNGVRVLKMNIPAGGLPDGSLFAGGNAGENNAVNRGVSNSFFGVNAGAANIDGSFNSFFGNSAGASNAVSSHNSFFGYKAGFTNNGGLNNSFFGESAGYSTVFGSENSFFGVNAGINNRGGLMDGKGSYNTFIGFLAGGGNTDGSFNTSVGHSAGARVSGSYNTSVGYNSGEPLGGGGVINFATAIGSWAQVYTDDTVVIGKVAGTYGGLARPADTVVIPGNLTVQGTFSNPSDVRLKTGIDNLHYGLSEVMRLRPVTWTWKNSSDGHTQLGLIAQDVRPILPELVLQGTDKDGMLSMNYIGLLPVIVRAVQEQQATIMSLKNEIAALQRQNSDTTHQTPARPSVESPNMTNVCNGNVTTDSNGEATVTLPDDFEAQAYDFRYQLTVIGQFAQAIISSELKNNRFQIKTDKPNVRVSWEVAGIWKDGYINARRKGK